MKRRRSKDVLDFDLEPKIVSPTLGLADDTYGFSEQPAISRQAVIKNMKNRRFPTVFR